MVTSKKLQDDYFKRVGRNVVEYKRIEKLLKIILPILEIFANHENLNSSKFKLATLGHLINQFIEKIEVKVELLECEEQDNINTLSSLEKSVYDDFRELVQARNQLIHCSDSLPNTEEEYQIQIKELDYYYDKASTFSTSLINYMLVISAIVNSLCEYKDSKIYTTYLILKENLPGDTVFIDFVNPWETTWFKTQIIEYVLMAEKKFRNPYGWTSLSHAGNFIRQSDKNITPRRYGLSKLKDVLIISGLFNFYSVNNQLFYKSKYCCITWKSERKLEQCTIHIK
ncbi:hypothetical protein Lepto7376_0954 [[Leptolyngbya] sp. PCC 7376]|uniref:OST-HTH/LOTUS domain-containing protein n=1 Tax=[Leptolyngbya] sp. PCC 7376 TaxID=111781 RepID=UPI00029EF622|nr:OST-HTH/LOTUS domain-containing protein [[Leptolyngbya] sp. PCC 7376]AFY37328.1 hypothetical protein Lepto7376_0954 [[Leptolyngbya] sp. PCC 7376]